MQLISWLIIGSKRMYLIFNLLRFLLCR